MSTSSDNSTLYKVATAALAGVLLGGVIGGLVGHSIGSSSSSPAVSASADSATDEGWTEGGATSTALVPADPSAPLPVGVNKDNGSGDFAAYGYNYNEQQDGRPTVILWEDFQCPGCAGFELSPVKSDIVAKADSGEINLIYRPIGFLDYSLRNNATQRATAAWGCAIDAGVGDKYRSLIFANQPREQGAGFTDTGLLQGGELAGLSGADYAKFADCVTSGKYLAWSQSSTATTPQEVGGTPSIMIDGVVLDPSLMGDSANVNAAIEEAKK